MLVYSSMSAFFVPQVHLQAQLQDPHVVNVYDMIESGNELVIIMEFCEGGNLMEWIERNRRHQMINEKVVLLTLLLSSCLLQRNHYPERIMILVNILFWH